MKYIVLDDEPLAANYLADLVRENDPKAEVTVETNPLKGLDLAKREEFHVYFIDIQMPGLNGVDFAKELKKIYPRSNFIFVTGYDDYMRNAFDLDASDYIMKPASSDQVGHAIQNLRYQPEDIKEDSEKRVKITCFGNFDILVDERPVKFKFDKTKELLAFLVHRRGARTSNREIMAHLWEDEGHDSYFRMLKKDLRDCLQDLACQDLIYTERGYMSLAHPDWIQCDYFSWLEDKEAGADLYHGEYMAQYSWAEEVNSLLEQEKYYF